MKKIIIYDFDSTLFDTLDDVVGREIYLKHFGVEYPHKGWWGREETLDDSWLPIKPIEVIAEKALKDYTDSNSDLFLITGRLKKLKHKVVELLEKNSLNVFNEVYCNDSGKETFIFKTNKIKELVEKGNYSEMFFYDDRESHRELFYEFFKELNLNHGLKITYVFFKRNETGSTMTYTIY